MDADNGFHGLIGTSSRMRDLQRAIRDVAQVQVLVLIHGESGVGKELVARALHAESDRRGASFHAFNTGAIPSELVESELFGHEKGAFTGASAARQGIFEAAVGGTVFLDEVATMEQRTQISLLRFLETRRFNRVGGTTEHTSDVRILAATNVDLATEVQQGRFRADLYYRLNVFPIHVAPLRDRKGDVAALVDHFLRRYRREFNSAVDGIDPDALALLEAYHWPGNVRQLANVMVRLVVSSHGATIGAPQVRETLAENSETAPVPARDTVAPDHEPDAPETPDDLAAGTSIEDAERRLILNTLSEPGMSRTRAAELLGISRKALYNKIKQYGIDS